MCSSKPLVSVIVPTYKRADMLDRAIKSILNQTYENVQVIVVDDNDPVSEWRFTTEEILSQFHEDRRVRYIKHERNKNGAAARNTGIKEAEGEIISFLDDDDIYLPTKIEKQVNFLISHPEYHGVYCGYKKYDKCITSTRQGNLSFELLCGTKILITNVIMMWKKCAVLCGGWDESLRRHQEAGFLLRFFDSGYVIGALPEVLVEFDMNDRNNAPSDSIKNEEQVWKYIKNYEHIIEKCQEKNKNARKIIYSRRYISIILEHIKHKNFRRATANIAKALAKMPLVFLKEGALYVYRRVAGKIL